MKKLRWMMSCWSPPYRNTPRRNIFRGLGALMLLVLCAAWPAHATGPALLDVFDGHAAGTGTQPGQSAGLPEEQVELVENSREAGLLTDWHLVGHYGHGRPADFARRFAPERWAAREAAREAAKEAAREAANQAAKLPGKCINAPRYELVFPAGTFVLPPEVAKRKGVFYALSCTYLTGGGEWNVYMESVAEAVLFVDGRPLLTRGADATGTLRETIHAASGFHLVMVKFVAQAAPFRVAILPLNSGSRRKNNTPYLQRSPVLEDLSAALRGGQLPRVGKPPH